VHPVLVVLIPGEDERTVQGLLVILQGLNSDVDAGGESDQVGVELFESLVIRVFFNRFALPGSG